MDYFVHESSYVDEGVTIGKNTKIWYFCHIQSGAVIGENCSLGQNVNINNNVIIGNYVKMQNNLQIGEGTEIGDGVFIGPGCTFTNDLTPRARYPKGRENYLKTIVKEGATLGANSTIVCGNTIGKCAMIAAGSVITRDVPAYALMKGVPAKQAGWVCECGQKLNEKLACAKCMRKYKIAEEGLEEIINESY